MKGFLIALAVLSAAAGILSGSASLVALGAAVAGFLLFSRAVAAAGLSGLSCKRLLGAWTSEDARLLVRVEIRNRSRWPFLSLSVEDTFPADRESSKTVRLERILPAGARETVAYPAECSRRRGVYTLGPLAAVSTDPLGLFTFRKPFPDTVATLTVTPRTFAIDRIPFEGRSRWDTLGLRSSLKAGTSLNFFGTREYRQGDNIRFIHWPSTARTGKWIVKEFESDLTSEVTILLDLHYFTIKGSGRETTLDYAVRIAASMARLAIERASQVQLLGQGKSLVHVPLGMGSTHLMTLLNELAQVSASGETPMEDLLLAAIPFVNGGSTVVILFNSVNLDLVKYVNAITILRAKGVRILAVLIDDNTFLDLWQGADRKKVDPHFIPDVIQLLMAQGVTAYRVQRGDDLTAAFLKPYTP